MKVMKKGRLMFKFMSKPSWKISEVLILLVHKGKAVSRAVIEKRIGV